MVRLLVVGGSGLLGSKVAAAAEGYEVVATYRSFPPSVPGVEAIKLDKERPEEAASLLREADPDFVVDAAAFHNVDGCEKEPERAWTVNAEATEALAQAAAEMAVRYLYVSTDYVFDGTAGPYEEDDDPSPVNVYGETKAAGERATLEASIHHQVVRPSVIFGWDDTRLNFATWVLTSLRDGEEVRVVTDWLGSPTLADSLAEGTLRLQRAAGGGVYHLAGPDCLSRYDFALRLAEAFDLPTDLVQAVTSDALGMEAPRPPHSCLLNTRAARYGIKILDVDMSLARMRAERKLEEFEAPQRFKS